MIHTLIEKYKKARQSQIDLKRITHKTQAAQLQLLDQNIHLFNEFIKDLESLASPNSPECVKSSVVDPLFCDCSQPKGVDTDEDGFVYCIECQGYIFAK